MLRLCIFNSMSKIDYMGRVLMSWLWDVLIHCFGTHLANMWENFHAARKYSKSFHFMLCLCYDTSHVCNYSSYIFSFKSGWRWCSEKQSGRLVQHEIAMLANHKIHSHEKNETLYYIFSSWLRKVPTSMSYVIYRYLWEEKSFICG